MKIIIQFINPLKLNLMANNYVKNPFKFLIIALIILLFGAVTQAQTDPADAGTAPATQAEADGPIVRVIDNKGTIKYMQSNNGITTITSTTPGETTTTTWQLGGTLLEDTYIDVDGNVFAFDGIELVDTSALAASVDAVDQSDAGTGTGWTILVRDEATGAVKKLLATDLIQSGQTYFTVATDGVTVFDLASTTAGLPGTGDGAAITELVAAAPLPAFSQVYVYRNGAKLIAGIDYTITTPSSITLVPVTTAGSQQWNTLAGDVIEVHYIK